MPLTNPTRARPDSAVASRRLAFAQQLDRPTDKLVVTGERRAGRRAMASSGWVLPSMSLNRKVTTPVGGPIRRRSRPG